ncbi:MAG: thioredoxin family protein [bacterium]
MKVLKFGAAWCSGCLVMKPVWTDLEKELPWLVTEYYDYDENQAVVDEYQVNEKLPTFIFLDKNNQEILRLHGEVSKAELLKTITAYKDK